MVPIPCSIRGHRQVPSRFTSCTRSLLWFVGDTLIATVQDASWVPLEVVGSVIADIHNASSNTIHVVHRKPVSWWRILDRIAWTLSVTIISLSDWLAQLGAFITSSKGNETTASPF